MSNEIIPYKEFHLAKKSNEAEDTFNAIVEYRKVDRHYYSFNWSINDADIRMDESDKADTSTDFSDIEFQNEVNESHKEYYIAAAVSGILTGTLSQFRFSTDMLGKAKGFTAKEWKAIIAVAATVLGYRKKDYKGAVNFIISKAVRFANSNEGINEAFTVLAQHPTVVGLFFNIIAQYSGKGISLSESGKIVSKKLPDYYYIAENNNYKIACAVFYWLFNMACDEFETHRRVLEDLKIPDFWKQLIKVFINSDPIKSLHIPESYEEAERKFSEWLKTIIESLDTTMADGVIEDDEETLRLKDVFVDVINDSFLVVLNEGLVHAAYCVVQVCDFIRDHKISSFAEFAGIKDHMLIVNERVMSRMVLIASGAFAGVNLGGALLKTLAGKQKDGKEFAKALIAEISIPGIARSVIAIGQDAKYWSQDIKIIFQRAKKAQKDYQKTNQDAEQKSDYKEDYDEAETDAFESVYLSEAEARVLYSLENLMVKYDIDHAEKEEVAILKQTWREVWKTNLLHGMSISEEFSDKYFIEDEDALYDGLYKAAKEDANRRAFYLIAEELALFKPYTPLGHEEDKSFKKLKATTDYVADIFVRKQTVVTQKEIDNIRNAYKKYTGIVNGSTKNIIIGASVATVVTVATGGVALAAAPSLAVLLAGEAVVGLHGAALTSASLAFVGGGSLAAGGLGMAGGTAIITGGGALLGLATSGTAAATTIMLQTSRDYWVRQGAKLITYCDCVLDDVLHEKQQIASILHQVEEAISQSEKELEDIKADHNDLDKELISKSEDCLKILRRVRSELKKIVKEK